MPHVLFSVLVCFCGSVTAPLPGLGKYTTAYSVVLCGLVWTQTFLELVQCVRKSFLKQKHFHLCVDIALDWLTKCSSIKLSSDPESTREVAEKDSP